MDVPTLQVISYAPDRADPPRPATIAEAAALAASPGITWIDITQPTQAFLQELGDAFGLHPLAIEDVHHVPQRSKIEDYEETLFLVAHMPRPDAPEATLASGRFLEQVSMFVGKRFVITIQEIPGDAFAGVRERVAHGRGRIRKMGADYLAYALFDAVVDAYFPLIERMGDRLSDLEDEATTKPSPDTLLNVRQVKRDLLTLRRTAWPQRDAAAWLERAEHPLISKATRPFLRDVNDHATRILDAIEVQRELSSDVDNLYMNTVNTRTNDVMKVLTIVATIFIPLSFIAGVYGMNFNTEISRWNMPETQWLFGYPFALFLMGATAFGLLIFMMRKGWLR